MTQTAPEGNSIAAELASNLPVGEAMADYDVRLNINGIRVELIGLNYLRSPEEAFYYNLIMAYSNREKRFTIGGKVVNIYHDDEYDEESGEFKKGFAPVIEDFSTRPGPISYFSFGEILRSVGRLFAGEEVHVVLRGDKTERFSLVLFDVLTHFAGLMRASGATVLEETLENEEKNETYHFFRRVMREGEDGASRYACNVPPNSIPENDKGNNAKV